jgi:hypothetical protein
MHTHYLRCSKHHLDLDAELQLVRRPLQNSYDITLTVYKSLGRETVLHINHVSEGPEEGDKLTAELSIPPDSAAFLPGLLFNPADGGDMFFLNVRLSLKYTDLQKTILFTFQFI